MKTLWVIQNPSLGGTIPPELGNITSLVHLVLSGNNLSGTIPPELGKLANLAGDSDAGLDLSGNQHLTGPIPGALGKLRKLVSLVLENCAFTGTIPSAIANLTNLKSLKLKNNKLTGIVPNLNFSKYIEGQCSLQNNLFGCPFPVSLSHSYCTKSNCTTMTTTAVPTFTTVTPTTTSAPTHTTTAAPTAPPTPATGPAATVTSFLINVTFAPNSAVVVNVPLFWKQAAIFSTDLRRVWNKALIAADGDFRSVRNITVRSIISLRNSSLQGNSTVIVLTAKAERDDMTHIWASLNGGSNASFQQACAAAFHQLSKGSGVSNVTPSDIQPYASCSTSDACYLCDGDKYTDFGRICGHDVGRGDCAPGIGPSGTTIGLPGSSLQCICTTGYSGQFCSPTIVDVDGSVITLSLILTTLGGALSCIVSVYTLRKYAITRLRNRHRASINGCRATRKYDCGDRIAIALFCGTYHEDDDDAHAVANELLEPLSQAEHREEQGGCCAALRRWWCCCEHAGGPQNDRADFESTGGSRNDFFSAESHASSLASGAM
jgi:hypothetical protein